MNKVNAFIVLSVADNIVKMSDNELKLLADTLVDNKNAEKFLNYLDFALLDKDIVDSNYYDPLNIEVQEPVC